MQLPLAPEHLFDLASFPHKELFFDCTHAWQALEKLAAFLHARASYAIQVSVPSSVFLDKREQIAIGEKSVIEPGAYIRGPCIIGARCVVRHGAYVRGNVVTGDDCIIGHASEIKQAILLNEVTVPHFNYVGDSILGNGVHLGAGVICANLRFDGKNVSIRVDGKRWDTGLRKLGAILGDRVQIGCHAVLNPGTICGKEALCYPSRNISGFFEPGARVT